MQITAAHPNPEAHLFWFAVGVLIGQLISR